MRLLISFTLLVTAASASPFYSLNSRQAPARDVCTGLTGNAVCCATDVLNLADLDCKAPATRPKSEADLKAQCTALGQQHKCCAIPVLGQALFCSDPVKDGP